MVWQDMEGLLPIFLWNYKTEANEYIIDFDSCMKMYDRKGYASVCINFLKFAKHIRKSFM